MSARGSRDARLDGVAPHTVRTVDITVGPALELDAAEIETSAGQIAPADRADGNGVPVADPKLVSSQSWWRG